jgi:hypothetical protein
MGIETQFLVTDDNCARNAFSVYSGNRLQPNGLQETEPHVFPSEILVAKVLVLAASTCGD